MTTRSLEPDRRALVFSERLPLQAIAHAGGSRALVQLPVDGLHLRLGGAQQALDFCGDLGLEVVLEYLAFLCSEQFAALADVVGEPQRELVGALGAVVKNDVHDEAPVAGFGRRLVAERAQCALQFLQVFGDLPLHAGPAAFVVPNVGEGLFDATCQGQRRVDGPGAAQVGQIDVGQRGRQQAAVGKLLEACDGRGACFGVLGQRAFSGLALGAGTSAGFTGEAARFGGCTLGRIGGLHGLARVGQFAAQVINLGADGLAQRLETSLGVVSFDAADDESFFALLQLRQRLGFARALQQQLWLRTPPFLRRLHQPVLGVVEGLQGSFDRRQRTGGQWQAHVGGVALQAVACSMLGVFRVAALGLYLVQPGAGGLEFTGANCGVCQRLAQRLVGRCAAPFVFGLAPVGLQLFEPRGHGHAFASQAGQALRNEFQALAARHRAGTMADVDRLHFAPGARQRAEAETPVGRDPGFGGIVRINAAGHAAEQAFDGGGRHRGIVGQVGAQPIRQRSAG